MNKIYRCLPKLVIGFILLAIIVVSCVQIIDRRSFNEQVIEIAKKEAGRGCNKTAKDSSIYVIETFKGENRTVATESDSIILVSNSDACSSSHERDFSCEESPLDILSKSNALLNANDLRFCITMIVSLMMSLLLYRIEKMETLVEQNKALKEDILSYYTHTSKFDNFLTRIESVYNLTITIGNITISMPKDSTDLSIPEYIGGLCSRLSKMCSEIDSCQNQRKSRLDFLTKNERGILNTYLGDTLGELERIINGIENCELKSIIKDTINDVENIKDLVDGIELKG